MWKTKKIKEVIKEISGGGTPSTQNKNYWNGDILWLTPTDVTTNKKMYIDKSTRTISELGLKNSSAKLLKPNTILMTSRATIAEVTINTVPMTTNQGFINIVFKEEEVIPEYAYFWIKFHKGYIESQATGSTFKEISKGVFKNLEFSYPDLPEQKNIIAQLKLIEDQIEISSNIAESYKELRSIILYRVFGAKNA